MPTPTRYTVVYEGDPGEARILNGEPAPGQAISIMLGDSVRGEIEAQGEIRRLTRERDRAMEQANEADARVVAVATENCDLRRALCDARYSVAGGNAIRSTADLLRWVAPRTFAAHGETDVPTAAVIMERATMLDAALRAIVGALDKAKAAEMSHDTVVSKPDPTGVRILSGEEA